MGASVVFSAPDPLDRQPPAPAGCRPLVACLSAPLSPADPLLVIRRHVDFLRIGSALCFPRPLTTARHS
jgi:hypothetical protein